ncbi:MAG: cell division protein FtsK [Rhodobacteraceae bacterium]|nr:cell division protein FtsK [Paracoccaceae bacterium]
MAYNTRSRDPLLDSTTQAAIERRGKELIGIALIGLGVAATAMILSYTPDDPNWMVSTDAPVQNWLGRPGASISAPLFMVVGWGALGFAGIFLAWGIRFLLHLGEERAVARLIFAPIAVAILSVYAATLVPGAEWNATHSFGLGGLFGDTAMGALLTLLPMGSHVVVKLASLLMGLASLAIALFVFGFTKAELSRLLRTALLGIVMGYSAVLSLVGKGARGAADAARMRAEMRAQRKAEAAVVAEEAARAAAAAVPTMPVAPKAAHGYLPQAAHGHAPQAAHYGAPEAAYNNAPEPAHYGAPEAAPYTAPQAAPSNMVVRAPMAGHAPRPAPQGAPRMTAEPPMSAPAAPVAAMAAPAVAAAPVAPPAPSPQPAERGGLLSRMPALIRRADPAPMPEPELIEDEPAELDGEGYTDDRIRAKIADVVRSRVQRGEPVAPVDDPTKPLTRGRGRRPQPLIVNTTRPADPEMDHAIDPWAADTLQAEAPMAVDQAETWGHDEVALPPEPPLSRHPAMTGLKPEPPLSASRAAVATPVAPVAAPRAAPVAAPAPLQALPRAPEPQRSAAEMAPEIAEPQMFEAGFAEVEPEDEAEIIDWADPRAGVETPEIEASDSWEDSAPVAPRVAAPVAPRPAPPPIPVPEAKKVVQNPARKPPQPSKRARAEAQPSLAFEDAEQGYELPPLNLLTNPDSIQRHHLSDEALEENARMLENVLDDYGVKGEIVSVRPGPVVTMYELEPAPGLKASRVIGLADDIARSMSALSARVSTVPGRSVIGIELPNDKREMVVLREILASRDFDDSNMRLPLALGKDIGGESMVANLAKMPHLLIAGTTGSGKSVAINTMILSLLYKLTPDECRLIMIDPKMLELSVYDGIPHLLSPVVTDPKKAVVALKWTVGEMEERYRKMSKMGVRNIDGYNARVEDALSKGETFSRTVQTGFDDETGDPVFETEEIIPEKMPYIVVIVDEMADLMMVAGKEIEACIQRLAQMARASGIHLIMATQRPSVDVITGTIKANFPTRISFQVTSKVDSRTILGEMGAEQLLGMGDMLYMAGGAKITRCHGPFVSDEEVEDLVNHLKAYGPPTYMANVLEGPDEERESDIDAVLGLGGNTNGEDALYDQAVQIVIKDRKCSTSYIQRKLGIGYNKAARLVEQMEDEGLVSPANHVGKREILVPEQQ